MPSSALVKEGDDVKLVCEADGNPAPVFSFYKREVRPEGAGHLSLGRHLVSWLLPVPCPEGPGSGMQRLGWRVSLWD